MRPAYHFGRYNARVIRRLYGLGLPLITALPLTTDDHVDAVVVAFSSARDVPEQVASIRSFLRYVGEPKQFTVVSDGSHTPQQRKLLRRLHRSVGVIDWDRYARRDLPDAVYRYADASPMGKKLAVIASLPPEPCIYVDSDVLFFPGARRAEAREVFSCLASRYQTQGWKDGYVHELLSDYSGDPVNAGFFILATPLDWTAAFAALPEDSRDFDHYLEQTLVHIALREDGATALPMSVYPLHNCDQFLFRDAHMRHETALRHYVSVTRPKFWLAVSRQSTFRPLARRSHRYVGQKSGLAASA